VELDDEAAAQLDPGLGPPAHQATSGRRSVSRSWRQAYGKVGERKGKPSRKQRAPRSPRQHGQHPKEESWHPGTSRPTAPVTRLSTGGTSRPCPATTPTAASGP